MLYLLLLFPVIWPFIAKRLFDKDINWFEVALNIGIVVIVTVVVWHLGKYGQTSDTQILNGQVVEKRRVHDSYVETYECNCSTDKDGNRSCMTCTQDHYTVKWFADTTVGKVKFDSLDSTSKSVYKKPDPKSYKQCYKGQPVSLASSYTNYVKAVPESLFGSVIKNGRQFDQYVPSYPQVYNFYQIDRVISVDSPTSKTFNDTLNFQLNNALRTLGPQKQVNIVVILTNIIDPNYRYAVESKWLGGKKNDVVIMIGLQNDKHIIWADVMSFALNSGNEALRVTLRDSIIDLDKLDTPDQLSSLIVDSITQKFDRISMSQFEYLEDQIEPPTWVIVFAIILSIGGSLLLSYVFTRIDVRPNYR